MDITPASPFLQQLRGRINLKKIPFSERRSRLLVFQSAAHLYIRLAERWVKWESEVGSYRLRSPILDDLVFTDALGQPLAYQLTAYPHALLFQTRIGDFTLTFADDESLYLKLPAANCGITFRVFAVHGRTDRRGGEFKGDPFHRETHRNIAYTTNAHILSNTLQPDVKGYLRMQMQMEANETSGVLLNITPRLGLNRAMPRYETILRDAEQRWHQWFAAATPVDDKYANQYYYAWWILRAGLLSPRFFLTYEAMMPSPIHYVGVWAWDAFFHAIAYRHIDQRLAENQIRVLLDHQRDDGMIPDAVHDEGIVNRWPLPYSNQEAEVTKPPLMAWTALKLYQTSGNRDFLDEIYEPLERLNDWWLEKNDDDHDGIVQYNHPYSSGLDDNPMWDEGMPVESPDINTYLVMQMDALSSIAGILGLADDVIKWKERADALTERMIAHFWDAPRGIFWAMRDHQPIPVVTPFNLYPLMTGRLPRDITARLVAHIQSAEEFWTTFPLPTVAQNDPKFNPNQMWRGPTWVNINYLFIEGLIRTGHSHLARELRDKTLELLMHSPDIYEYYNPQTGEPPPQAAAVFGWSSAVFIDLAIKASRGEII